MSFERNDRVPIAIFLLKETAIIDKIQTGAP